MSKVPLRKMDPLPHAQVTLRDEFWAVRQEINHRVTLRVVYEQSKRTGRIDAWKLDWKPGDPNPPHIFWDSDVAKWLEGVAHSLAHYPDAELEALADAVIDDIAAAQQDDGYLNIHFTVVEPEKRWSNLRDWHELYCAGHLMEAAVAYYRSTGKRKLLDTLCRYADYIATVFGPGEGQKHGYPGHEEIELALVKLYRVTGERRYLDLAAYFVNERGRRPYYYDLEAEARGEPPARHDYTEYQSHLPIREQTTAEGHAVRATYFYSGATDVADETGDESLLSALRTLWLNATRRRMYVTGGIGSSARGERFTADYDLPNELAYAETCASIGLALWAHRMLQIEGEADYADVLELALYNGMLGGVSLDGRGFFYANPLAVYPGRYRLRPDLFPPSAYSVQRQEWFSCACCPTNIVRTLASIGEYIYSQNDSTAYVHLYVQSDAELSVGGRRVTLHQETRYPWDGAVRIAVEPESEGEWTLALRIPAWCRRARLAVNDAEIEVSSVLRSGYANITRTWHPGDVVTLVLDMPVELVEAHPAVHEAAGKVALRRGPLIYCLEEVDNGPHLDDLALLTGVPLRAEFVPHLLGGVVLITGQARRRKWDDPSELYRPAPSGTDIVPIKAVPFYARANRQPGEMIVWMCAAKRQGGCQ